MLPNQYCTFIVTRHEKQRLDQFLAEQLSTLSRTACQKLVEQGCAAINGASILKYSTLVKLGDHITVTIPEPSPLPPANPNPANIHVDILLEHEHFLALCKPPNLMVHTPSTVNNVYTLVDWLIGRFSEISTVGSSERPGIVHRLDKDTSGVILVAKNSYGLMVLGDLFKNRQIHKTYHAIVEGAPPEAGTISTLIDAHPVIKTKKMVSTKTGKEAVTHYRVLEYFNNYALVELKPVTGRTHQLRVHCANIGHPIIGDKVYGRLSSHIDRQALHAYSIAFELLGQRFTITAPLTQDIKQALGALRAGSKHKT